MVRHEEEQQSGDAEALRRVAARVIMAINMVIPLLIPLEENLHNGECDL